MAEELKTKSKKRKLAQLELLDEKQIMPRKTKKYALSESDDAFTQNDSNLSDKILQTLVDKKQWGLVERWLNHGLITSKMLDAHSDQDINILWEMACGDQWGLIRKLIERQLITSEMLARSAKGDNAGKGMNALWWIAAAKQWDLFKALINQGVITPQMLLAHPEHDANDQKGVNILWWVACADEMDLMKILMEKQLVTSEMLLSGGNDAGDKGINILWLMSFNEEWDSIQELIKRELLTSQMLSACAESEEESNDYGISVLWQIADKKNWNLLKDLITGGLVTAPMLLASPRSNEHTDQGSNTLYLMAINQQWNLIGSLAPEINTQALLSEPEDEKTNALTLILESMQIGLIKQLLDSPLAPLQRVPWDKFNTKLLMRKLMEDDKQTFEKLIQLGVSHPQAEDEKKSPTLIDKKIETNTSLTFLPEAPDKQTNIVSEMLDSIRTENLEGFKKLLEEKRQALPGKESLLLVVHKIVQKNNFQMLDALVTVLGKVASFLTLMILGGISR